ncbi:MAG: dienelactone hydrolase family protein [Acidimicrobiia bacterium]|nr:dienelactone hydrolase family protein [Acidimicrobiia bacterium]
MALQKGEGRYEILHRLWSVTGRADEFDAWLTQPNAPGRFASVGIACDVFGLTPQLKETAKLLSRMGYHAVVPDLYYRVGGIPAGAGYEEAEAIACRVTDGRMLADLEDASRFLMASDLAVDDRRMGLVGFGMGGRTALLLAARLPGLARCVVAVDPVLGKVEQADGSVRSDVVPGDGGRIPVPVLAIFSGAGEGDTRAASREDIARFEESLGNGAVVTFPDARPGFLDEVSSVYDAAAAEAAYVRIIDFLDTTLGSDPA